MKRAPGLAAPLANLLVMDHDPDQSLIRAVNAHDDAGVARALALGADPNTAGGRFRGPVMSLAAAGGQLRIVRRLLDAGASVRSVNPHLRSPLRAAVHEAHPNVAELLIEHGALEAEPASRGSLLADAIAHTVQRPQPASLEVLRLLLRHGA